MLRSTAFVLTLFVASRAAAAQPAVDPARQDWFGKGGLRAVIGDNGAWGDHREKYNGVYLLERKGLKESPFVPFYAGLNLEHYFDAVDLSSKDRDRFFEPRNAPMNFRRIDAMTAELHQPATPHFGVESWTTFTVDAPNAVDMAFRCTPHKDAFAGGVMGVFWASYINAPEDKSIYFLQEGSTLDAPVWVQLCTQAHGTQSTVRGAADTIEIPFDATGTNLYANFSPLRYSVPFYYGRFQDHALIFIFKPGPIVRFAHSPSGGGPAPKKDDTNPAWDFQLIVPDPKVGESYGLELRLVVAPWKGRGQVLETVRAYYAEEGIALP
ncbi:MAG: hypothetical protein HYV27_19165 [Candidatus Hydrogenedentes bacterium]|nr:hypothetical protein [Candidatus Hydrogenedentota bacterium]